MDWFDLAIEKERKNLGRKTAHNIKTLKDQSRLILKTADIFDNLINSVDILTEEDQNHINKLAMRARKLFKAGFLEYFSKNTEKAIAMHNIKAGVLGNTPLYDFTSQSSQINVGFLTNSEKISNRGVNKKLMKTPNTDVSYRLSHGFPTDAELKFILDNNGKEFALYKSKGNIISKSFRKLEYYEVKILKGLRLFYRNNLTTAKDYLVFGPLDNHYQFYCEKKDLIPLEVTGNYEYDSETIKDKKSLLRYYNEDLHSKKTKPEKSMSFLDGPKISHIIHEYLDNNPTTKFNEIKKLYSYYNQNSIKSAYYSWVKRNLIF